MNHGAPDSWEDSMEDSGGTAQWRSQQHMNAADVTAGMSGLNVEAAEFVPSWNINAPEFVPSFDDSSSAAHGVDINAGGDAATSMLNNNHTNFEHANQAASDQPQHSLDVENTNASATDTSNISPQAEVVIPISREELKNRRQMKLEKARKLKQRVNVVFIGHVDAGKSTIGGQILYLTGGVDERTMEKYKREAKEKNRETWYLSWALDENPEEREKGKTVEVGRAKFETDTKHFTILDAPGHAGYVRNMIGGAAQADVAVLVISARKSEFEAGFERGGQTREHAMLVKTAGVKHLIVLINKMDEPTVLWAEARFNECRDKLIPFLKSLGFNPQKDLVFIPCSGYTGAYIKDAPAGADVCPWYRGPTLLNYLESMPIITRAPEAPLRIPIIDRFKEMGTVLCGKIEAGVLAKGDQCVLMPNRTPFDVLQIWADDEETEIAAAGANVKFKVRGLDNEEVLPGFVACEPDALCHTASQFDAHLVMFDVKSIVCAGYAAVMHLHCLSEEVIIKKILCTVDKKTGEGKVKNPKFLKKDDSAIVRFTVSNGSICLESFNDCPQMGRFNLRDEGKTVAVGKVLSLKKEKKVAE